MVAAFFFSMAFMVMAIYIPGFARLLDLVPLDQWQDWIKIVGAVCIQTGLSELLKFGIRSFRYRKHQLLPVSSVEQL